jgi:hypothetical protein
MGLIVFSKRIPAINIAQQQKVAGKLPLKKLFRAALKLTTKMHASLSLVLLKFEWLFRETTALATDNSPTRTSGE